MHLSTDGRQRVPAWYPTARFYCKIQSYLHCFYTHILRNPSAIITARVITAPKRCPLLLGFQDITRNDVVTLCVLGMTAAEWGQLCVESLSNICVGIKYLRLGGSKGNFRPSWECQARLLNTFPSAPSTYPRAGSENPLSTSTLVLLFKRKVQVLCPKSKISEFSWASC